MKLIIFPSPSKEQNVNERLFNTVSQYMKADDHLLVEDTLLEPLESYKNISAIVVLLDNYGKFIEKHIDFITKHKEIRFYIHENDIHKTERKAQAYNRYMLLRSKLLELDHVYILAYYWYHYKRLYPIKDSNLICFPKFVIKQPDISFRNDVVSRVLLSGSLSKDTYPVRNELLEKRHRLVDVLEPERNITGVKYIQYLGGYLCCFTCCANERTPYLINKFFEIPYSGSLLLAYDEWIKPGLQFIGMRDGVHYIRCNPHNMIAKIEWICHPRNRAQVDCIRRAGQEWVTKWHTDEMRYKILSNIISKNG